MLVVGGMLAYSQQLNMIMWVFSLPLAVKQSKTKVFQLNLNIYRNAHYQTLNKVKISFQEQIAPLLKNLPSLKQVSLSYELYPQSHRLCDVANICSVVDKFFSDALVNLGYIADDNYQHVLGVQYLFGSVDSKNPRVEVTINPIT